MAGDPITVLQQPEGGWWEGTVGGKVGWFPSNHVKPMSVHITPRSRASTVKSVYVPGAECIGDYVSSLLVSA